MTLSWIEDITSEYFNKTEHIVFTNVSYFATSLDKKQPAWQEFDILAVRNKKAKIVSCKRGLGPEQYDRQANILLFHRENLLKHPQLEKFRRIFLGSPELILVIEYPRKEHVKRILEKGIKVISLRKLLREYLNLLQKELEDSKGKEGKEKNYATRLLKGLLKHEIIKIKK